MATRCSFPRTVSVRCAPLALGEIRKGLAVSMRYGANVARIGIVLTAVLSGLVLVGCGADSSPEPEPPQEDPAETAPEDGEDAADEGGSNDSGSGEGTVEEADWRTTPREHRGQDGSEFVYDCPAGGDESNSGPLWGDELYTDDSAVCLAAVHAGEITFDDGGTVTIVIEPGEDSYDSAEHNDVESSSWGSWSGSYRFVAGGGWIED